jgi:hypothetical protein
MSENGTLDADWLIISSRESLNPAAEAIPYFAQSLVTSQQAADGGQNKECLGRHHRAF